MKLYLAIMAKRSDDQSTLTFSLPIALAEEIESYLDKSGGNRSEFIRNALIAALEAEGVKLPEGVGKVPPRRKKSKRYKNEVTIGSGNNIGSVISQTFSSAPSSAERGQAKKAAKKKNNQSGGSGGNIVRFRAEDV